MHDKIQSIQTFCPHCGEACTVRHGTDTHVELAAVHRGDTVQLRLLSFPESTERCLIGAHGNAIAEQEGDALSDLLCPHCGKSIVSIDTTCESCGTSVAALPAAGEAKLTTVYVCLADGCTWNGLSKRDLSRLRPKSPRGEMPEQDPRLRTHSFTEVPYGYTSEIALAEAQRCLQCRNPKCVDGCPVNVDIPAFIKLIGEQKFIEAARSIKERNILPAICGRVCPQEDQCEARCVLGKRDEPVAIGNLERFVADFERNTGQIAMPHVAQRINKRVAVVGSGPAGLTVAADLSLRGYTVTLYEALHQPGGVLVYGIPEFRLPKAIVASEISYLEHLGCRVELNYVIGRILLLDELLEKHDAVFLGLGAGLPRFMRIDGENLNNVFSANEYLTRMNLMKAYRFPEYDTPMPHGKKVVVIGGGNVAMDSVRTALRADAQEATIVYRRSKAEMPARKEEIRHAEEEGVRFKFLTAPIQFLGTSRQHVSGMECVEMELGEPDQSGRRRPIPIDGSNFRIECDLAVVAVGTGPNPLLFDSAPDLRRNAAGYIEVNPETMETSKELVYAGGDIVTGSATVIQAMGAGRIAATSIHRQLSR